MRSVYLVVGLGLLIGTTQLGCDAGDTESSAADAAGSGGAEGRSDDLSELDSVYASYFPIGVALQESELEPDADLIAEHFNHLTAGNAMKAASIHPTEGAWNTAEADYLADFARDRGWKMTGHTLVWHRQQPAWFFSDLTPGDAASIETLKGRLKDFIEYMVNRYGDVVDNWDVVNEIVNSNTPDDYRTEDNQWYEIFQSFDYVYWAFRYTRDALEAREAGSSVGKLYYNDFNVNLKLEGIFALLQFVENHPEGAVQVDGIGLQSHVRIDWPSTAELESTIQEIAAAEYTAKISELDVSIYNDYPPPDYAFMPAAEVVWSAELEAEQAGRYADLFALFRRQAPNLTSVTLWGFRDEDSWLNNEPVRGRANYPLLFNARGPKQAFAAIQDF